MKKFCEDELHGICGQGSYQAVVEYLESCEDGAEHLAKYRALFETDEYVFEIEDSEVQAFLRAYEDYLKHVLMTKMSVSQYEKYALACLKGFFPGVNDYSVLEKAIPRYFEERGYFASFGVVSPLPSLTLWKKQTKHEMEVELPEATVKMNVYEMDEIVTRGWYDYLTFGKVGTGGWVSDDGCYYFKQFYEVDSENFKVSLLKHEGQHFYDQSINYIMPSHELEYRAKLTELVYLQEPWVLNSFLLHMSDDKKNPHGYANKRIVTNLSKLIFNEDLVTDKERWAAEYEKVSAVALQLLKKDTATSKWLRKRVLRWSGKIARKFQQWWKKR